MKRSESVRPMVNLSAGVRNSPLRRTRSNARDQAPVVPVKRIRKDSDEDLAETPRLGQKALQKSPKSSAKSTESSENHHPLRPRNIS